MPLEPGSSIGPYFVEREIGRGGMGVVYLAKDPRLQRDVAIKALPDHLAGDPVRLERFRSEARTLAQLNHPSVASIHGVEEKDGQYFLILEYVEGETLSERLERGAPPVDEAIELAIKIATGIEAAHEAGVIHRDLKPDNIRITPNGDVKILDFGLAKIGEATTSSSDLSVTATATARHSPTLPGMVLGTAAYMSPEQARGRNVDKRTDVWSFGVVLYEMLVGASPFHGETASDSLGAVLHKDIDLNLLPAGTPPMVRHILMRCLERNRENRYRDIGDVRIELERPQAEPQPSGETRARGLPLTLIAVVALAMAVVGAGAGWLLRPQPVRTPLHVAVPLADRFESVEAFRLSPDGETLAIVARERAGENESVDSAIYVRTWSEPAFRKLPETDRSDRRSLVFSPSGEQILFRRNDEVRPTSEMRTVPLDGGPGTRLYSIKQDGLLSFQIGYRSEDELVAVSDDGKELYRVRADGGAPELIAPVTGLGDRYLFHLQMPRAGGRYVLAWTWSPSAMSSDLYRVDLETGEASVVLEDARRPHILPGGYLAFSRDQSLWVVPFDPDAAEVTGTAIGHLSNVGDVSLDRSGERAVFTTQDETRDRSEIVIVDEADRVVETLLTVPGEFRSSAALSPDGGRLAYVYWRDNQRSLWVLDITSGLTRQVSPRGGFVYHPQWLPDGRLAFLAYQGANTSEPKVIDAAPGMTPQPLLPRAGDEPFRADELAISPDGRHVLLSHAPADGRVPGVYLFDLGDGDSGRVFYASERDEGAASFRPDGQWVVYTTNGTGRYEVYLRPFVDDNPDSAPIYPVTRLGGRDPTWSPDGRTLYYAGVGAEEGRLFAVTVETEPELEISERRTVFGNMDGVTWFVPMSGGRGVKLQSTSQGAGNVPDMRLILNWDLPKLIAEQQ